MPATTPKNNRGRSAKRSIAEVDKATKADATDGTPSRSTKAPKVGDEPSQNRSRGRPRLPSEEVALREALKAEKETKGRRRPRLSSQERSRRAAVTAKAGAGRGRGRPKASGENKSKKPEPVGVKKGKGRVKSEPAKRRTPLKATQTPTGASRRSKRGRSKSVSDAGADPASEELEHASEDENAVVEDADE